MHELISIAYHTNNMECIPPSFLSTVDLVELVSLLPHYYYPLPFHSLYPSTFYPSFMLSITLKFSPHYLSLHLGTISLFSFFFVRLIMKRDNSKIPTNPPLPLVSLLIERHHDLLNKRNLVHEGNSPLHEAVLYPFIMLKDGMTCLLFICVICRMNYVGCGYEVIDVVDKYQIGEDTPAGV